MAKIAVPVIAIIILLAGGVWYWQNRAENMESTGGSESTLTGSEETPSDSSGATATTQPQATGNDVDDIVNLLYDEAAADASAGSNLDTAGNLITNDAGAASDFNGVTTDANF